MLQIKDLSIRYRGYNENVFQSVSFSLEKGETVSLLGPSGCGKTTLLGAISGLIGKKEIEKKGVIEFSKDIVKDPIRMVFQTPRLLPWKSVKQNISYGLELKRINRDETEKKTEKIIEMIGLEGYEDYLPSRISLGMQQRVNFARALVCEPEILLLDEPFSALDINTKKRLQKDFLGIIKDKKISSIFVTHSIEEALETGDKIYVFFEGKNIKKGFYLNEFNNTAKNHLYLNMKNYLKPI